MKTIASTIELEHLVTEYQQHLLNDAGLTVESCRVRLCHLRAFLTSQFKPKQELDLRQITPQTLLNYVLDQRQRLSLETLQSVTGSLRSFCRFLCFSGRVDRDLSPAVPSIAAHQDNFPAFLSRREVDQLLEFPPNANPARKRDCAIVLCLARLGLRAGEVARLTLEDINWRTATIRLVKTKGRRERQLPLPAEVGRAGYSRVFKTGTIANVLSPCVCDPARRPAFELGQRLVLNKKGHEASGACWFAAWAAPVAPHRGIAFGATRNQSKGGS